MTVNISGFGSGIGLIASVTYPIGIIITQFADDADPFDSPVLTIGDTAMGLNGDLLNWSKANPIKITLNVVPLSVSDIALGILLEANRVGKGKTGARDIITMAIAYPSKDLVTLTNGFILEGMPLTSVASAGRMKSKSYQFSFEGKVGI